MPLTGDKKREYDREWMRKRRDSFFSGKKCIKCNGTENLQLDHINRESKVTHRIWSLSDLKRQIELAKCQILCAKCHKGKTKAESITTEHGSTMYTNGCRCDVCKEAEKLRRREYRKRIVE